MWVGKVVQSFRFALDGLKYTVVSQRNMRIHFLVSLAVLLVSLYLPISKIEVLLLFVTITLVLFAELINTAVEAVVDMVTKEYHPLAKIAKDVAAGAVLLTAGLAVMVGVSIFYPYLNLLFSSVLSPAFYSPDVKIAAIIFLAFLFTLMLKALCQRTGMTKWEPSMTTSLSLCTAIILIWVIWNLQVTFLVILLLFLFLSNRLRRPDERVSAYVGVIIGSVIAAVGIYLLSS
ncbi:diacylglycerol kinase family protein [Risungbinella massiliensis]|uniref:diacylglycerol kinase family protein n=1 Tax=Risungbinella massiliensis TaxID=1329796 RepID=UPI0005CB85C0|nr:diacylglycerol kinase family protein [Risungbinella massiliensis]